MATVTLSYSTNMAAVPTSASWSGSVESRSFVEHRYSGGREVTLLGSFQFGPTSISSGTATAAVFTGFVGASSISFLVSELNFPFKSEHTSILLNGLLSFLLTNLLDGNDLVRGSDGTETLKGFAGKDILQGGPGGDVLDGGSGTDTASYAGALRGVVADLAQPQSNTGDASGDSYLSIENLDGSAFNDRLFGDNGANVLRGSSSSSQASGRDYLYGRGGKDTLLGHDGNDLLDGGAGRDLLTGGAGADRFDYNNLADSGTTAATRDVIMDFRHGVDRIDLRTIDASRLLSGNNAFVWRGKDPITTSSAGEVSFKHVDKPGTSKDYTLVLIDVDADRSPEMTIELKGLIALSKGDFFL